MKIMSKILLFVNIKVSTCKSGARILGTCAHVTTILWFLGCARYEQNIRYQSISFLIILYRLPPENIDRG